MPHFVVLLLLGFASPVVVVDVHDDVLEQGTSVKLLDNVHEQRCRPFHRIHGTLVVRSRLSVNTGLHALQELDHGGVGSGLVRLRYILPVEADTGVLFAQFFHSLRATHLAFLS